VIRVDVVDAATAKDVHRGAGGVVGGPGGEGSASWASHSKPRRGRLDSR
jgi:hypothetical protein